MNTEIRTVQRDNADNEVCQYAATTALDEVLAVFVDDRYDRGELLDLIEGKLDDLYEDAA